MERSEDESGENRGAEVRAYDFEIRSVGSNGRTLEGHVAVFRSVARIPDRNGEFDEEIHPGIFNRYLEKRGMPVMQFDHGKDPRTGTVPIGVFNVFEPDNEGYFVRSQLFDNPVVEPIRQAIEHRAIKGWSWRMQVQKNGDRWIRRSGGVDKRDIFDADVPEAGPVVFPAYRDTKMSLRSWLDSFEPEQRSQLLRELAEELTDFTGQPARGVGGGDPDTEPRRGDVSIHQIGRERELTLLRRPLL